MRNDLVQGEHRAIKKRGLTAETARKWDYRTASLGGERVQAATYYDKDGKPCAQKLRYKDKRFEWVGQPKEAGLFGSQLFSGGRKIVITEGELDAMSVSQIQDYKWPVVSIPSGAGGAKKSLSKNSEWLENNFEEIILMFDSDDVGREAAAECSEIFTPGKCKIAQLPRKDPNEMLLAGEGRELVQAIWSAKVVRPDGIVAGDELWDIVSTPDTQASVTYPWPFLDEMLYGQRPAEIVTWCAGTGIGKSQVVREVSHHCQAQGVVIGLVSLEESLKRTALGLMSLHLGRPLHLPTVYAETSAADLDAAYKATVGNGKTFLYDHWGSLDSDHLVNKIRYMVRGCGVQAIFLDHISIMVSGMEGGDERRIIDNTMTSLRSLAQELEVIFHVVSHLRRPQGEAHEEGGLTSMSQLRGSAAIGQLSDAVIGLERDQQGGEDSNITTVRVLKNRFSGQTGIAGYLEYNEDTGRMTDREHTAEVDRVLNRARGEDTSEEGDEF